MSRNWPLIRRLTYMRRFVDLGQSYRAEIERANRETEKLRAEHERWVAMLVPHIETRTDLPTATVRISFEITRACLLARDSDELLRVVALGVTSRLFDARRKCDYRGDLRQTEAERMLGL